MIVVASVAGICGPLLFSYFWFLSPAFRLYARLPQARFASVICGITGLLAGAAALVFVSMLRMGGW
jgi:hypothetical protein